MPSSDIEGQVSREKKFIISRPSENHEIINIEKCRTWSQSGEGNLFSEQRERANTSYFLFGDPTLVKRQREREQLGADDGC